MASTTSAALNIVTGAVKKRPFVNIDGTRYDIAIKGDLGLADQVKLQRLVARWEQINDGNAADLTDEQAQAVEDSFRWAPTVLLLDVDAAVVDRLDDDQRVDILMAFSKATGEAKSAPVKQTTKPRSKRTSS